MSANTSHHSSSGGSSSSSGECIRWEPIVVDMAGADMAQLDMSSSDMAGADMSEVPLDLGPLPPDLGDPHAGMRCVEYAGLFDCSFTPARAPSNGDAAGAVALGLAALLFARARRRRDD